MSKNSLDSTFAFVFFSNKPRKAIAPFEAILCEVASKNLLDFAISFVPSAHITKPNELYFFVRPAEQKLANKKPKSSKKDSAKKSANSVDSTDSATNPQNPIIDFANAISENLPLSMDFVFGEIKNASELKLPNILPKKFASTSALKKSIPSVLQTKALLQAFEKAINTLDSANKDILDSLDSALKPFFVDICFENTKIDFAKGAKKSSELVCLISNLSKNLAQGQSVQIRTARGDMVLNAREKSPLVLFWELGALQSYMRVNQAQISLLGSFEKPSMKLCPKEVFAKEFFAPQDVESKKSVEIQCVLAFEPLLALLGVGARAQGVEFVFAKPLTKSFDTLGAKSTKDSAKKSAKSTSAQTPKSSFLDSTLTYSIPPHKRIACDKNGTYIEDKRTSLNLFSLIRKHYPPINPSLESSQDFGAKSSAQNAAHKGNATKIAHDLQMLVCYLSKSKNSAIWVYQAQNQSQKDIFSEILHIDFSLNPAQILEQLATYPNGKKLIANFKSHFGESALDFGDFADEPSKNREDFSQNLIAFFAVIAKVLGYCDKHANTQEGIQSVLNNAKLFLRDKGPRIDYKTLKSPKGGLNLDMPKILQSTMSFTLAGVDSATLCYGVIDSLCEFVGGLARDMGQNYAINKIFLCGDILAESIFLDKILHYIPKDLEIILPQDGFVDTL